MIGNRPDIPTAAIFAVNLFNVFIQIFVLSEAFNRINPALLHWKLEFSRLTLVKMISKQAQTRIRAKIKFREIITTRPMLVQRFQSVMFF